MSPQGILSRRVWTQVYILNVISMIYATRTWVKNTQWQIEAWPLRAITTSIVRNYINQSSLSSIGANPLVYTIHMKILWRCNGVADTWERVLPFIYLCSQCFLVASWMDYLKKLGISSSYVVFSANFINVYICSLLSFIPIYMMYMVII